MNTNTKYRHIFTVEIQTDNAAFDEGGGVPETARILRTIADQLERDNGLWQTRFPDLNGNTVAIVNWRRNGTL